MMHNTLTGTAFRGLISCLLTAVFTISLISSLVSVGDDLSGESECMIMNLDVCRANQVLLSDSEDPLYLENFFAAAILQLMEAELTPYAFPVLSQFAFQRERPPDV